MTAQNSPLALPLLYPPAPATQHHQFVLLLHHPGCCHHLTCLNEALSVTALKCDSFINKVTFPMQHHYFSNSECAEEPCIIFTHSLLNLPVLLTLAVIFLSSQDAEVTASQFWKYWSLTVDSARRMDLSGGTDPTSICYRGFCIVTPLQYTVPWKPGHTQGRLASLHLSVDGTGEI